MSGLVTRVILILLTGVVLAGAIVRFLGDGIWAAIVGIVCAGALGGAGAWLIIEALPGANPEKGD